MATFLSSECVELLKQADVVPCDLGLVERRRGRRRFHPGLPLGGRHPGLDSIPGPTTHGRGVTTTTSFSPLGPGMTPLCEFARQVSKH